MKNTKRFLIDWGSNFDNIGAVQESSDYSDLLNGMSKDLQDIGLDILWAEIDRHEFVTESGLWDEFCFNLFEENSVMNDSLSNECRKRLSTVLLEIWEEVESDVRYKVVSDRADKHVDQEIEDFNKQIPSSAIHFNASSYRTH